MRIVTWNTRGPVAHRLHNVTTTAADVIGLQECEKLDTFGGWNVVNAPTHNEKKWVSILSKHELEALSFPFSNVAAAIVKSRMPFLYINIWSYTAPNKKEYTIFNRKVIEHVLSLSSDIPCVISGDFNGLFGF